MFEKIIETVKSETPLVHCITNYVTVNDVANILLACGASPIMADDVSEAAEITSICKGLAINIGTLNVRTIEAMKLAGKRANELGHITVLDPVGAGASTLRTDTAFSLLKEISFSVIRGNISEMKTLYQGSGTTSGVDASVSDRITENNLDEVIALAKELNKQTGAVIAITGVIDIVTDGNTVYIIRNGHPMMSQITGTGCMLTGLVAAYCAANPGRILEATAAALLCEGIAGELAYEKTKSVDGGTSSFRMFFIDAVSQMTDENIKEGKKVEVR
ncbi:hydroxyethylthiazole kinase [Konateibacter massiliensis]|uniref:hydroxyethylthiazole kinase n=1 Tax=Konateibacter massiliensis TaxID=2002841 RepID=UPI000C158B06|nr:hydroxyethylthiazole kinase [Konateibacter massiliensis]